MDSHAQARLEKVKRMSRSARRVCFLLMALVSLGAVVMTASSLTIPERLTCEFAGVRQPCAELPAEVAAFTVVTIVIGVALILTALHRLARLFQHYARGEIFTRSSVREIRVLGYVAVAYAIFQLVMFVATLALVAGSDVVWPAELRVDPPIGTVVLAFFVLLFSWVMDVGAELREENELTV